MINRNEEEIKLEFSKRRWKNRRIISWISFIALLLFSFAMLLFDHEKIDALVGVYSTFSTSMVAILMVYFGTSVWDDKNDKNSS